MAHIKNTANLYKKVGESVTSSVVKEIVRGLGADLEHAKENGSGKGLKLTNFNCPLHAGSDSKSFVIWLNAGSWKCPTRCGSGSIYELMNGAAGKLPRDRQDKLAIELAESLGIDTSPYTSDDYTPRSFRYEPEPFQGMDKEEVADWLMGSSPYRKAQNKTQIPAMIAPRPAPAPVLKPNPSKPPKPTRDLTEDFAPGMSNKCRRETFQYLNKRIPGLYESAESFIQHGNTIDYRYIADRFLNTNGREYGYTLAIPLYDVAEPQKISSATCRNTIPALKPDDKDKALNLPGPRGGKYSATYGRIDQALEAAKDQSCLIVCEGLTDYLTMRIAGFDNVVGLAGNSMRRLLEYLTDKEIRVIVMSMLDNDKGSDQSHYNAGVQAQSASFDLWDARPPRDKSRDDINKLFNHAGGGQAGIDAIQSCIDAATPYDPAQHPEHNLRAKRDAALKAAKDLQSQAKLQAQLKEVRERMASGILQQVLANGERARDQAAAEAKRQSFDAEQLKEPARYLAYLIEDLSLDLTKRADVFRDILRILQLKGKALDRQSTAKLFELASDDEEDGGYYYDSAAREAIDFKTSKIVIIHKLIKVTKLDKLECFFSSIADMLGIPRAKYLVDIGFAFSMFSKDRVYTRAQLDISKNPRSYEGEKKQKACANCGEYGYRSILKDSGEINRNHRYVCSSNICGFCQSSYASDQLEHHLAGGLVWKNSDRVILARVDCDDNDPRETRKIVSGAFMGRTLRKTGVLSVQYPAKATQQTKAGVLFVAEYSEQNLRALNRAFGQSAITIVDGHEALNQFAYAEMLAALTHQALAARLDKAESDITLFPWKLKGFQSVRVRNKRLIKNLPWLNLRAWKEYKKSLEGKSVDERPQDIEYIHDRSGIVLYRHDSNERGLLPPHEVLKLGSDHEGLQEFLDKETRDLHPNRAHAEQAITRRVNRRELFAQFAAMASTP